MARNCILDLPLSAVMKQEIALPLQFIAHIYTVGQLVTAWRLPRNHKLLERYFDSPAQARHAVAVCSGWLGLRTASLPLPAKTWWRDEIGATTGQWS